MKTSIKQQIRSNLVALLSLVISINALFYNTWRNELSEDNRNLRTASFTVLKSLAELQIITDFAHYQSGDIRGNPINGWGYVLLIEDMSDLLPEPMQQDARRLKRIWEDNWAALGTTDEANRRISKSIGAFRQDLKGFILTIS